MDVASKTNTEAPEEKPEFLNPLRDMSVEEGEPMVFSASFKGNPVPDVCWTKNGKPIKPSDGFMLTCDGKKVQLEINPSNLSDTGAYVCKLKNKLGEDSSKANATVRKVYQPPNFAQKFTDIQQVPKSDAKFLARVTGIPSPDISWHFNGQPIHDGGKYKIKRDNETCCLYVKDCTLADAGRYRCEAVNKEGKAHCEAALSVIDKM